MSSPSPSPSPQVYKKVAGDFLPTTEKFHYVFNIRDVAKVVQGVLQASSEYFDGLPSNVSPKETFLRLWCHEVR